MISKKNNTKFKSIAHGQGTQNDLIISEINNTRQLLHKKFGMSRLIGRAPSFICVLKELLAIAKKDVPVLLFGEVGTEKELFAQAIHYLSKRKDKPYLVVNSDAVPSELFENELFGNESDIYVDARKTQPGYLVQAEGGTLFINEADSMSNTAQARLMQFFQEKKYQQNGKNELKHADARIIVGLDINLLHPKANGYFSKDLLCKLDEFSITIPPLRCRRSDIPLLANYFIGKYTELYKLPQKTLSETALSKLMSYHWFGNIKELENVLHRCVLICKGSVIEPVNITFQFDFEIQDMNGISFQEHKIRLIEKFERDYLARILKDCDGDINQAINLSKMSRRNFYHKIKKYNIHHKDF